MHLLTDPSLDDPFAVACGAASSNAAAASKPRRPLAAMSVTTKRARSHDDDGSTAMRNHRMRAGAGAGTVTGPATAAVGKQVRLHLRGRRLRLRLLSTFLTGEDVLGVGAESPGTSSTTLSSVARQKHERGHGKLPPRLVRLKPPIWAYVLATFRPQKSYIGQGSRPPKHIILAQF
ncbi:hypothetical protein B0H12DRAFT_153212 [Mycena haematopus]|nr:hypothetical protein B0H12DRAFT_153212 [Mycena haematopus]